MHSLYFNQDYTPFENLSVQIGARVTYYKGSTDYLNKGDSSMIYTEPNLSVNYKFSPKTLIKAVYSYHVQPIHQLQVSSYGIAVSRWMPSNKRYLPEESFNYSLGFFSKMTDHFDLSTEVYYRKLKNLIETMQEMRLIYETDPERFIYHSSATATGYELGTNVKFGHFKGFASYSYTNCRWKTMGINNDKWYPASFNREHSVNISGIYRFSKRITLSTSWQYASGMPYTAASRIYYIDGKKVLDFDKDKINTKKLPPYHRLDLSLEVANKKNDKRKWKSYWNYSIYNAYFRKNR
jgi:outer membrane receptor protein involved in Fe transport